MFCGRSHYKDGRQVAALPSTVKGEFPTIVPIKLYPGLRHRRHGGTTPEPFLVGIECLTTKPIYSSARRFHDGKISGYSSTPPEKLSDDEEVNP
jgi:hypothetical protein